MRSKQLFFTVSLLCAGTGSSKAQDRVSIPAYTAYAVPAEQTDSSGESLMFGHSFGLRNWKDKKQEVFFYFRLRSTGILNLALRAKNNTAGNPLTATINGKSFFLTVPRSPDLVPVRIGTLLIRDTGFYSLRLSPDLKKGETIAEIGTLELSGEAVKNIQFNSRERRNAASVHLLYPLPDSTRPVLFYNELTVPEKADILYSYYMACGFSRGYFGIQVNSDSERRVIFSVWDAGNEATDRGKVKTEDLVQLVAKGEDVYAGSFGNEGTGGHSHWLYNWKSGTTYRFLITAAPDSTKQTTAYAGYFFVPETQKWKLIACFSAPRDGRPFSHLYSFVEDFEGSNGQQLRKAFFGNPWVKRENGEWMELTTSQFSCDATGKAGDRLDYGGGTDSNRFYLWNGGFLEPVARAGNIFSRIASGTRPVIDLYQNADSAKEAVKEKEQMLQAIGSGSMDTTGSTGNLYYQIQREGTGDPVTLNDTVIVMYKGKLLNGTIFDETTDKPATFAVKRLIKGMQAGLSLCRTGTRIRLMIPSALAYATRNLGVIPPNSVLVFETEVLEIRRGKR
jgi:hypothetical protein